MAKMTETEIAKMVKVIRTLTPRQTMSLEINPTTWTLTKTQMPEAEVEPAPDEPPEIDKELNLAKNIDSLVDDNTELDPGIAEEVQQAIIGNRN